MRRVGNLFERAISFENLLLATRKASRGKKAKLSVARFVVDHEKEIIALQEELTLGRYQPRPYNQFRIYEPKERNICSSEFRDRVVHHAICNVLEPCCERRLITDTYACRVGRGAHLGVSRCQKFSRRHGYYLKCDISKYFESIDHERLKSLLGRMFKDRRLLDLVNRIIDHHVPGAPQGKGLPIGNLTSQHFANLYLGELDHFVKERLRIRGYLRYMDDFILFHDSREALKTALREIESFVGNDLRLKLKPSATILAPTQLGIPFLGFRVFPNLIRIQRKNLIRMRRKIRAKERAFALGKITEEELTQSLESVHAHVAHANVNHLLRKEVCRSLSMA